MRGTLLGCATALAGFLYVVLAGGVPGPFLLWPRTRARTTGHSRRIPAVLRYLES
ncbi:hypothetical protein [Streptomyces sp. NBC_01185]|uniref:hypothetical protein n=1 Tax=Streptomyces sp. NBC_01185 TaxID=2903764 RepID=UPI00386802AC|nr:hypothetical protein OG770_15055 [Streptomyces sp. NBC_01185]